MSIGSDRDREEKLKLIDIVRATMEHDHVLRDKFEIGEKFRFVRERLKTLLDTLEKSLPPASSEKNFAHVVTADQVLVYVYLYNAQGLQFRSWQNLMVPKVFYEYSVNRPIYADKNQVETLIRTKANKAQHAYLTIAVNRDQITRPADDQSPKDALGNPLIKVREGSLQIGNVIAFTHQDQEYVLNEVGELVKKDKDGM